MSGTVDIRRVLLAVMATAALVVVLAAPNQAEAANDCAAAGTDPTAAQYCPPTEPQDECLEGEDRNGDGKLTGSECVEEEATPPPPSAAPPPEGTISEGGTLPFTGSDVLALLAVASAFIAVGMALQRLSRTRMEHR